MKNLLLMAALIAFTACQNSEKWTSLMPDRGFTNWRTIDNAPGSTRNEIVVSGDKVLAYAPARLSSPLPEFRNFVVRAQVMTDPGAASSLWIHHAGDNNHGYEIALTGHHPNGTRLSRGSLVNVRNVYKNMAPDSVWWNLEVAVRGKNITVSIDGTPLVDYVEPAQPWRIATNRDRLAAGTFVVDSHKGTTRVRDLEIRELSDTEAATGRTDAADESTDRVIRLQQSGFPLIDHHIHLKGWSKEQAMEHSRRAGIFYAIAPNCGIGFPVTSDADIDRYIDTTRNMPAINAMQGEGREWPTTFSAASRAKFDFVFTDALTFTDHAGRRVRLWIDDEVIIDVPVEKYMDQIVDASVAVITNEPIDVFVNPFFLPTAMMDNYDALWTDARIARVVKALASRGVALEVNARYRIPNARTIRAAMDAGVKLTFGTNNADPNVGALEYCFEMMDTCGITSAHMFHIPLE
jgi:hypothetical protein